LAAFAAEAWTAWALRGINLLLPTANAADLPLRVIAAIYAAGVLASLPLTFVPFAALFEGKGIRDACAVSMRAFYVAPLLLYAAMSFALLFLALATFGVGLILVLPWIASASYAAWKDIFALDASRRTE